MKTIKSANVRLLGIAIVAVGTADMGRVRADVLFNNYGPGYTYQTNIGGGVNGTNTFYPQEMTANRFTPLQTGAVNSVVFGASLLRFGGGTNNITFALMTDAGGAPGTPLESYSFADQMGPFGDQNPALSALSLSHPILVAGTNYWMVASPGGSDTSAVWNWNDQGMIGTVSQSSDGGSSWYAASDPGHPQYLGAFEIFTSVPEPTSLSLFGLGATMLLARHRRKL